MKLTIIILIIVINSIKSQSISYFNITPNEMSGDNGQSQYYNVESDSSNIYVLGDIYRLLQNKDVHPFNGLINYKGEVKRFNILVNKSSFSIPYDNKPMIKKSEGVYWLISSIINPRTNYITQEISEINLITGEIIKNKTLIDFNQVHHSLIPSFIEYKNGSLRFNLREYSDINNYIDYIYEIDSSFSNFNKIKTQFKDNLLSTIRWLSKQSDGNYELIREVLTRSNNKRTFHLEFILLDSNGVELKHNTLPELKNYCFAFADVYTIHKNHDNSFTFACRLMNSDSSLVFGIPYVVKVAPEFQNVIWKSRFHYVYPSGLNPDNFIYSLNKMNDNSGYIVCGDISTIEGSLPDYGVIFKVSVNGDSLWLNKYQPLSWDSLRAFWMELYRVNVTPYNTIIACGRVADNLTQAIRGWIMHLDSDGCLVPGCNKILASKEIESGSEKPFKIYPNPSTNSMIYILSQFSSSNNYHLELSDLTGKIIKNTKFQPTQGMQYLLNVDNSIPQGEYILRMIGKEFQQTEKIIIEN